MDKLNPILSKINNEIDQEEFNDKIKCVIDLRENNLVGLGIKEKIQFKKNKNDYEITLDDEKNTDSNFVSPIKVASKKDQEPISVTIVYDYPPESLKSKVMHEFDNLPAFKLKNDI